METVIKKNRPLKPGTPEKRESQTEQHEGQSGVKGVDKSDPPSDNDQLAADLENSSNKGQGPAGENL
jgi:hypothetical protein